MDIFQSKSNLFYKKLIKTSDNLSETVGRPASFEGEEYKILDDIHYKMNFEAGTRFLDVGCGYGYLVLHFLNFAKNNNIELCLIDIDDVIDRIEKDSRFEISGIKLIKGVFPDGLSEPIVETFDYILVYSVLHYTSNPELFIEKLVSILNPGGILLLGDLPNINRLGRFLLTQYGRKFEANYKGKDISEIPVYKNNSDFIKSKKADYNYHINDELIYGTIRRYRDLGHDVWVSPQPMELPYSNSREDLIIKKRMD